LLAISRGAGFLRRWLSRNRQRQPSKISPEIDSQGEVVYLNRDHPAQRLPSTGYWLHPVVNSQGFLDDHGAVGLNSPGIAGISVLQTCNDSDEKLSRSHLTRSSQQFGAHHRKYPVAYPSTCSFSTRASQMLKPHQRTCSSQFSSFSFREISSLRLEYEH